MLEVDGAVGTVQDCFIYIFVTWLQLASLGLILGLPTIIFLNVAPALQLIAAAFVLMLSRWLWTRDGPFPFLNLDKAFSRLLSISYLMDAVLLIVGVICA